jgi:hypothetical protein
LLPGRPHDQARRRLRVLPHRHLHKQSNAMSPRKGHAPMSSTTNHSPLHSITPRRVGAIALTVATALSISACGSSSSSGSGSSGGSVKVALILKTFSNPYFVSMERQGRCGQAGRRPDGLSRVGRRRHRHADHLDRQRDCRRRRRHHHHDQRQRGQLGPAQGPQGRALHDRPRHGPDTGQRGQPHLCDQQHRCRCAGR